jgi:hypothetical protein
LSRCSAFSDADGAAIGWLEVQGVGIDDRVGPAAFVLKMVVESAKEIEVRGVGFAVFGPVLAMVGVAVCWCKLLITTVVLAGLLGVC